MNKNCLIIAGEKSGEEHCLSFYDDLRQLCPEVSFWGVGGDDLASKDMEILYNTKDFCAWGISEVIGKIPYYLRALKNIENEVIKRNCKVAILIDFQDFNLRLSKKLKELGVEVLYYVAPTAWIWKPWRAKALAERVNTLFTLLPFEKQWFLDRGVKRVKSIQHPLIKTFSNELKKLDEINVNFSKNKEINLLLLPGSRNFEVKSLLPAFVEAAKELKSKCNIKISLVRSSSVNDIHYDNFLDFFDVVYESDNIAKALLNADLSFAASGTVTLTAALFQVPTIVCYKVSSLNAFIFNNFIKYNGPVSLANIVVGSRVFPELLQEKVNSNNIIELFHDIIKEEKYISIKNTLKNTKKLLEGEKISVPSYIAEVIKYSYEKKAN